MRRPAQRLLGCLASSEHIVVLSIRRGSARERSLLSRPPGGFVGPDEFAARVARRPRAHASLPGTAAERRQPPLPTVPTVCPSPPPPHPSPAPPPRPAPALPP